MLPVRFASRHCLTIERSENATPAARTAPTIIFAIISASNIMHHFATTLCDAAQSRNAFRYHAAAIAAFLIASSFAYGLGLNNATSNASANTIATTVPTPNTPCTMSMPS